MSRVRGMRSWLRQRSSEPLPPVHEGIRGGNVLGYCAVGRVRARRVVAFGGVPGEDSWYAKWRQRLHCPNLVGWEILYA